MDFTDPQIDESEVTVLEVEEDGKIETGKSTRKKPKSMRSKYYSFFSWLPNMKDPNIGKWKCNQKFCGNEYVIPIGGGTSSLKNHMERCHPLLLKELEQGSGSNGRSQPDIRSFCKDSKEVQRRGPITESGFRDRLVKFVVTSNQPFSLVEEPEFQNFVSYCTGGVEAAHLPCAKTIRKLTLETYAKEKRKLRDLLAENEGKISFIIDCWTSSNQHPFQGVVASYVDNKWELRTVVLDLTLLEGSHTGENICDAFGCVLDEFGLWNKLLSVTTDNASNMDTFFENLDIKAIQKGSDFCSNKHRVRCLAHILNLCCKAIIKGEEEQRDDTEDEDSSDGLDEKECTEATRRPGSKMMKIIGKLRSAVVAIRASPSRRQTYKRFCVANNITYKMLVRDIDVRWNSTLMMLERGLEMKDPLEATLNSYPKLRKRILSSDDWCCIEYLIGILKPFREATVLLSSQNSPTLSKTSGIYSALFSHLEKYFDQPSTSRSSKNSSNHQQYSDWLRDSAVYGWEKLKKYYPSSDGEAYIISTVLDPRCKLEFFKNANWKKEWIDNCRKTVHELWRDKYKEVGSVQNCASSTNDVPSNTSASIFDNMFCSPSSSKKTVKDDLTRYLSQEVVPGDMLKKELTGIDGALGWWKIHESEYPRLAKMAKDYLGILGSGVAVENFFCDGGDLIGQRRQSLCPESISCCMCLKNWFKCGSSKDQYEEMILKSIRFKVLGAEHVLD